MNPSVEINIRRTQVAEHRVKKLQAALDIEQYGHETTRKLHDIAVRTLIHHGFTYNGGEMWKPPLGPSPDLLLKRIDALTVERDTARQQAATLRAALVKLIGGDDKARLGLLLNEVASFVFRYGHERLMTYAFYPEYLASAVDALLDTNPSSNKATTPDAEKTSPMNA